MTAKQLNKAKKVLITFEIEKMYNIVIDKTKNRIFENGVDITHICEEITQNYTIGDMVVGSPYKCGMICYKILQSQVDKKCMGFLKFSDDVQIENNVKRDIIKERK